jgi:hypothetical protein
MCFNDDLMGYELYLVGVNLTISMTIPALFLVRGGRMASYSPFCSFTEFLIKGSLAIPLKSAIIAQVRSSYL